MALPLIPDALTQVLPGLAQITSTGDDTIPRALLIQALSVVQDALAVTTADRV